MKPRTPSFAVLAMALGLGIGTPALAADGAGGVEACGHLEEMAAAREALAAGERERAVEHLRAARAILVECERRSEPIADPPPGTEAVVGRDLI